MDTERYYSLRIEGLQKELEEIELELDAIFEMLAFDNTPMGTELSAIAKYLSYRSTKLKTRREDINKEIKELKKDLAAWKRFQKYSTFITEKQEKFLHKE